MGIPLFVNSCAKFSRKYFAIIHRTNDNDDKLIVMSDGQNPTNEYIEQKTLSRNGGASMLYKTTTCFGGRYINCLFYLIFCLVYFLSTGLLFVPVFVRYCEVFLQSLFLVAMSLFCVVAPVVFACLQCQHHECQDICASHFPACLCF